MRTFAVPALCLVIGIGLGVGLSLIAMMPAPGSRWSEQVEEPAAELVAAAERRPTREVTARPGRTGDRPPTGGGEAGTEARDEAAALIAAVDAGDPEVIRGSGQITGRVMDEHRAPVEGVRVIATAIPGAELRRLSQGRWMPGGDEDEDELSLEEAVARTVHTHRFTEQNRRVATTDDQGVYALTELGDTAYRLRAEHPGYEIEPERRSWQGVKPGGTYDFVAARTVGLQVEVLLPDGETPGDAEVRIRSPGNTSRERWTPEEPVLHVEPGSYELRARSESGDVVYVSDDVSVELALGTSPPPVILQLHESGGVHGHVIMSPGEADRGVFVYLMLMTGGEMPDLETLTDRGRTDWAERGTAFEFRFTDLDPGTYCIGATRFRNQMLLDMATVVVGDTMVELDLEAAPAERSSYVVVWIYGPDGELLRDVNVGSGVNDPQGAFSSRSGIRQEDGSWWVFHPEAFERNPADMDGVTAYVAASNDELGRIERLYEPGASARIELRFPTPASLQVTVLGYAGHPRADDLSLSLQQQTADGRGRRVRGRGGRIEDGMLTFERISPGAYEVILSLQQGGRGSGTILARSLVNVGEGETRATVRVPPLFRLTVNAPGLPPVSSIRIRSLDQQQQGRGAREELDESGRAIFEGLLAGRYRISADAGSMEVELAASSTVQFAPRTEDALEIVVDDPMGTLALLGLRTGDRIVGVGDTPMHNHLQIQGALLAAAGTSEPVTLHILRDGAEIELAVDGTRLMMQDGLGGRLEPGYR